MNLKIRIAFLFSLSVFIILTISAVTIFLLSENFRKEDFFKRVEDEAKEISEIYFKGQRSRADVIAEINQNTSSSLPDESFYIFDPSYHILFGSTGNYKPYISSKVFELVRANKEHRFNENERETVMLYTRQQGQNFYVLASATDYYGNRKMERLKIILSLSVLGGLLLSGLLAFFYVKQVIKPLENLKQQMQKINEQNLTERVQVGKNHDEVTQIAKNFNDMLDRLEQAFEMRKSFVQHASHELRTPLANMLSQTEAALSKPDLPVNYKEIFESLKEDQQDMINLMNALLILSQYEKINYLTTSSKVQIDEVLYEAVDVVKQIFPKAKVTINFAAVPEDDGFLYIEGNEALIKSAIQNLLKNACHYSVDCKAEVIIDASEKGVSLTFENEGKQLSKGEQERLFIPFFRGENSTNKKGFGLGLSIVQRIIKLHKGNISYEAINKNGNRFLAFFPADAK